MLCSRANAAGVALALALIAVASSSFAAPRLYARPLGAPTPEKVQRWVETAEASVASDPEYAYALMALAVKAEPENVDALFALARYDSYAGRWHRAEATLRRARAMSPAYDDVTVHLARVLGWQHEFDRAYALLDPIVASPEATVEAVALRGDLAMWEGDAEAAVHYHRRALQLAPDDPDRQWAMLAALDASDREDEARAYLATLPPEQDDERRAAMRAEVNDTPPNLRVDLALAHSFVETGDWNTLGASVSAHVAPPVWAGLRVDWDRRSYGSTTLDDVTLLAPVSLSLGDTLVLSLEGGGTPQPDFAPAGRASVEVAHAMSRVFAWAVGYRYARYASGGGRNTHTLNPSIQLQFGRLGVSPMLYVTHAGEDRAHLTGRLRLSLDVTERGRLELTGLYGTEPLESSLTDLFNAPRQAALLFSVAQDVGPTTRLRFFYGYSAPVGDANNTRFVRERHTVGLHLVQRFRVGSARRGGTP